MRKKEAKAEELQEAREELVALERELAQKNSQARDLDGGEEVIRGDEVQKRIIRLSTFTLNTIIHIKRNPFIHKTALAELGQQSFLLRHL